MLKFLRKFEAALVDLAKSVLIDAECLKFRQSLLAAGLVSVAFEIMLYEMIKEWKVLSENLDLIEDWANFSVPTVEHLHISTNVWEQILQKIYGPQSVEHVDNFGRYLILRQQRLLRGSKAIGGGLSQIYQKGCRKLLSHGYFDYILKDYHPLWASTLKDRKAKSSDAEIHF